jgi:cobalamin synthase
MFLTRLPVPPGTDHHPRYLLRSTAYFPLIGAAVGLWGAVFFTAGAALWPRPIAAGVSTLATVWLTGEGRPPWGARQC